MNLAGRLKIPRAYILIWLLLILSLGKKSKKEYRESVQIYKKVCKAVVVRHLRSLGYPRNLNRNRQAEKPIHGLDTPASGTGLISGKSI